MKDLLLCWFDLFSLFSKHSLSVSPNRFSFSIKKLTSVKAFHQYIVYFLAPINSRSHKQSQDDNWVPAAVPRNTCQVKYLHMVFQIHSGRYSQKSHSTFLVISFLLNFRLHKHQCFSRDTKSRKTATQSWRVLSTHETDYSLLYTNSVLYGIGKVVAVAVVVAGARAVTVAVVG